MSRKLIIKAVRLATPDEHRLAYALELLIRDRLKEFPPLDPKAPAKEARHDEPR